MPSRKSIPDVLFPTTLYPTASRHSAPTRRVDIPHDVLHVILDHAVDTFTATDFCNLASASRATRAVARPLIFRKIHIKLDGEDDDLDALIRFFERNEDLAKRVEYLALDGYYDHPDLHVPAAQDVTPVQILHLCSLLTSLNEIRLVNMTWGDDRADNVNLAPQHVTHSLRILSILDADLQTNETVLANILKGAPRVRTGVLSLFRAEGNYFMSTPPRVDLTLPLPRLAIVKLLPRQLHAYLHVLRAAAPRLTALSLDTDPDYAYFETVSSAPPPDISFLLRLRTLNLVIPIRRLTESAQARDIWVQHMRTLRSCTVDLECLHIVLNCYKPADASIVRDCILETPLRAIADETARLTKLVVHVTLREHADPDRTVETWDKVAVRQQMWTKEGLAELGDFYRHHALYA